MSGCGNETNTAESEHDVLAYIAKNNEDNTPPAEPDHDNQLSGTELPPEPATPLPQPDIFQILDHVQESTAYVQESIAHGNIDVDGGFAMLLDKLDRSPSDRDVLLRAMQSLCFEFKPSETMFEKIDDLMNRVETEGYFSLEMVVVLATHWKECRDKPERAISLYEEALTRDDLDNKWDSVFRIGLARLYSHVLGQHQKALEMVDKAQETRKDNVGLAVLLDTKGLILINAGNPTEAIPVLLRAVELSNQFHIFCLHLAYALHLDGRDAESRRYFDVARDQFMPPGPNEIKEKIVTHMHKDNIAMYDALMVAHP